MRRFPDVAEYQVHVTKLAALAELRVEVEPRDQCADVRGLLTDVREALEAALHLRIPVTAVSPGALLRFEMKAKRWLRDPN